MNINKSSPDTMEFLQRVAIRSAQLTDYDRIKLTSSTAQNRAANHVADNVIGVLDDRPDYRGPAELHGSYARGTNLAIIGTSDVDILCSIQEDYNANRLQNFCDFEGIRNEASVDIKNFLMENLTQSFSSVTLLEFWEGLCLKLRVKNHWQPNGWNVDVIFAFYRLPNNSVDDNYCDLEDMTLSVKVRNTNAFALDRNRFCNEIFGYDQYLRPLTRLLKQFNWISQRGAGCAKGVNSFVMEMLVVILYTNDTIPNDFELNRALCTCLQFIGYPSSRNDVWMGDWSSEKWGAPWSECGFAGVPFEPTAWQLRKMRDQCGDYALVIADPFSPFSNIAVRKARTADAWAALTRDAQNFFHYLESNGVSPY